MDLQERINLITNYIKTSRGKTALILLIASLASVFIFAFGSYYFLYDYFKKNTREYYTSMLKNICSLQQQLIDRNTYREDLKRIAATLAERRGVNSVWVTDRFGKLIYHTHKDILERYMSRRMPAEYYQSIHNTWKFEDGYPAPRAVSTESWSVIRFSVPIYAYQKENYDFILGMDAKSFIIVPGKELHLVLIAVSYFFISMALLFGPVFFFVRQRYGDIISQVRVLFGTIREEEEGVSVKGAEEEVGEEEAGLKKARKAEKKEEKASPEKEMPEEEEAPAEQGGEKHPEQAAVAAGPKEKAGEKKPEPAPAAGGEKEEIRKTEGEAQKKLRLLELIEKKRQVFNKQDLELDFVQASSFIYHSNKNDGCFFLYRKKIKDQQEVPGHFFFSIGYHGDKTDREAGVQKLLELAEALKPIMDDSIKVKQAAVQANDYCLENNFKLDTSVLLLDEEKKMVEFVSCGLDTGAYLKKASGEFKKLQLGNPGMGYFPTSEFEDRVSYAEMYLEKDEFFVMLPSNAGEIRIGEESLEGIITRAVADRREGSAQQAGAEALKVIQAFGKEHKTLPQTGFVVVKYL